MRPTYTISSSGPVACPKPDIRDIFSDIWAAVKFDAYPMKFGLRTALGVTDELNLMFRCSRVRKAKTSSLLSFRSPQGEGCTNGLQPLVHVRGVRARLLTR